MLAPAQPVFPVTLVMVGAGAIYSKQFMKPASIENASFRILIVVAIVLAIGCILLGFQIHAVDNYLFMRLVSLVFELKPDSRAAPALLDILFACFECGAAVIIGSKLASVPRTFALLQLFLISMIAQWLLFSAFSIAGHPLSSAVTVMLGGLLGFGFKRLSWKDERLTNQYYELNLRNRELQEARLLLVKQDEIERRVLAADLHDQVLNDLKTLKQLVERLERSGGAIEGAELSQTCGDAHELLERTMSDVREVMDSLCPSTLEHLGLPAAIEDCCRRGADKAGFKIRFKNEVDETILEKLSVVEKSLLYRLVQESITNICKHAEATKVRVTVSMENSRLRISIADDGKGINGAALRDDSRGIKYMRLRADLIGATVVWQASEENKGTLVEIRKEVVEQDGDAHPHR
jgi:signal transduction histidine kinase